jgi:hypothetical protein
MAQRCLRDGECQSDRTNGNDCRVLLLHSSIRRKPEKPAVIFSTCGTAEQAAENGLFSRSIGEKHSSGAKARMDSFGFRRGLKPPPPSGFGFSAACEAVPFQSG